MAIIFSYPVVIPTADDYVLGTDVTAADKPTKNFTVQSIIDLVTTATGDLQTVLDLGNTAVGKDINITNNTFRGDGLITAGGASITGQIGLGFTDFTSTRLTGTIQTAAQPNITSLGNLTALVIDGAISGTNVITSTTLVGASNTNIASTLAIKTYVDTQVGLSDTLSEVLANGNTTGATKIEVDNTGSGIDFIDDAKLRLGTGDDFEMYHAAADNNTYLKETGAGSLELWASTTTLKNAGGTETLLTATDGGSVDLYYNNTKTFETTADGVQIATGVLTIPVGSESAPSLTFAGDPNTGIYRSSVDTVGITGGGTLGLTVDATDTTVEGNLTVLGTFSSLSTAQASFGGKLTVSPPSAGTDAATKAYVDSLLAGKTLEYAGDATGPFALNLTSDDLEFNGDSNITVTAATVAANKGIVTIDLNNSVTITGTSKAGTFTTTAGTASWSTTVMTGFTSITSTTFIGALTGNASTATALASSGAIALTGDTTSTGGPYTYTSGGALSIATTIADTTVTAKVLTNLPTPTSSAIAATDTILAAMAKLQGQITGIPQGLVYKGTWNATTNTPTLASGTGTTGEFYIVSVAGATNLDGITDWQVGDWAIFVEVGATDTWQKIDNTSAILGSGTANKVAKWTGSNTLATGLIEDDGTDVTIGNSGNLIVEGNTTLGDADADTTTVKGPATFEETSRFNVGISLGAATYGTAGQVLTSGGGAASVNTWTTPSSWGYVESVTASTGITIGGTAVDPTVAITYAGASNAILAATVATPVTTDTIWFSDASDSTIKKALISTLPFVPTVSGTQYTLPMFATTTTLGDSMVSQNAGATQATVTGNLNITGIYQISGTQIALDDLSDASTTYNGVYLRPDPTGLVLGASNNIVIGDGAGNDLTSGGSSIFIGRFAGKATTSQSHNIFIGDEAGIVNTLGSNIGIGSAALELATSSSDNVAIGHQVAKNLTTGDRNIYIGQNVLAGAVDASREIVIGNQTTGNGSNTITLGDSASTVFYGGVNGINIGSAAKPWGDIYSDGVVQTSDGSETDPAYTFTSDSELGMYKRGTRNLAFCGGNGGVDFSFVSNQVPNVNLITTNSILEFNLGSGYSTHSNARIVFEGTCKTTIEQNNTITNPSVNFTYAYNATPADGGSLQFSSSNGTVLNLKNDRTAQLNDYGSGTNTGTAAYNLEVDSSGNIIETPATNPGGKSGTFYKEYTTGTVAAGAATAFTLTRATSGTLVFSVYLTATLATDKQVAKMYQVAHTYGQTPVYNKIIDTGPLGADITVSFANSNTGATGTSVTCDIAAVTEDSQPVGITVIVGHGATALTFA